MKSSNKNRVLRLGHIGLIDARLVVMKTSAAVIPVETVVVVVPESTATIISAIVVVMI